MIQEPVFTNLLNAKDITHDSYKIIDIEHAEIHNGKHYTVCKTTSSIAASSWIDFEIITPTTATAEIHIYFDASLSGGLAEVILAELSTSSTYTHGATGLTAINNNRLSSNTANTSFFTAGTNGAFLTSTMTSTQATLLEHIIIGSTGSNQFRGGERQRSNDEFVLSGGSTYVLRVWNRGTAGYGTVCVRFYEET